LGSPLLLLWLSYLNSPMSTNVFVTVIVMAAPLVTIQECSLRGQRSWYGCCGEGGDLLDMR
jgi:hypothetical protein